MQYRLVAFDLDGTLTQHKSPLGADSRALLERLSGRYRLLMLGAGGCERIYRQMGEFPVEIIGYYGMQHSVIRDGVFEIVRSDCYDVDREWFSARVEELRRLTGYRAFAGDGVEFHSSGAVTFPLIGTAATIEDKIAFDPDRRKRAAIYDLVRSYFPGYNVFIGGSSSFDIVKDRYDKHRALTAFLEGTDIRPSEVLFFGDDFGPGGNDESIARGGLDYVAVTDYRKIAEQAAFLFSL